MGLLNVFKRKDVSRDVPPPPELEELPAFPKAKKAKEPLKKEEKAKPKAPEKELPKRGLFRRAPEPQAKTPPTVVGMHERMFQKQRGEILQEETAAPGKPFFVDIEDYREMLDELNQVKHLLDGSIDVTTKLEELRHFEDRNFEKWKKQIRDVHEKLIFVDETLFKRSSR